MRQALRDALPSPIRRAIVRLLAPMRARAASESDLAAARRVLTRDEDRERYFRLVRDAEARWRAGRYDATGPLEALPVGNVSVYVRPGTSDVLVYRDVIVRDNYGEADLPADAAVLDCGANIGLVSVAVLTKHAGARVLAIEPDPRNIELCQRNLEPFAGRAQILRAAVWDTAGWLKLASGTEGTWASHVEPGSGDIEALTITNALERLGAEWVDLIKLDVEGAEARILSGDISWLARTGCLMIEIESDDARAAFNDAMRRYPYFQLTQKSDVTIATRPKAQRIR